MQSQLSYGNYQLLKRIASGEDVPLPPFSPNTLSPRYVREGNVVTKEGRAELKKSSPAYPHLGKRIEDRCLRCGQVSALSICEGEMR